MKRSYAVLFAGALGLGLALVALGHLHRAAPELHVPPAAPPLREVALTIGPAGPSPSSIAVPKGARVLLRVRNESARPVRLALAGYEDRLGLLALAPGAAQVREFLADRPGEDFAWLLDGDPRGRFVVTGSHLVEGHR